MAPRACACRGRLDPLGDHRAACANAGVLASRALPLERAVARVCQEAGAQVARNVRLADMNIDVPVSDDRRIEVVANGLPPWHGSQQAIDATIVSPVTRAGEAQPGADARPGQALVGAARRKRRQTYPELVSLPLGGRWCRSRRPVQYRSCHVATLACAPPCVCGPRSYAVRCTVRVGSSVVRPSSSRGAQRLRRLTPGAPSRRGVQRRKGSARAARSPC